MLRLAIARQPRHVLIIEDDRVTALVMSEFLSSHGYRTSVATNGQDGVDQFLAQRPDLALVDVALPKKNGFQACLEIKGSEHGKTTPVMMMSAVYRNLETAGARATSVEAEGFLLKPFDLDVLLECVHTLVGTP